MAGAVPAVNGLDVMGVGVRRADGVVPNLGVACIVEPPTSAMLEDFGSAINGNALDTVPRVSIGARKAELVTSTDRQTNDRALWALGADIAD